MIRKLLLSAVPRLTGASILGAVAGAIVSGLTNTPLGILVGIAAAETIFVVAGWIVLWPMNAATTHHNARREEFRPVTEELAVVGSASCGLVGIVVLLLVSERT